MRVEAATTVELPEPAVPEAAREIVAAARAPSGSELERLLELRVSELIAYQGRDYALEYAEFVAEVLRLEPDPAGSGLAEAVARNLFKLMAYKDEYEVARLQLDPVERARLEAEFGAGAKLRYKLHPPFLRALGMDRKLTLGPWFTPAFRVLRRMKRLRGTRLDPFGYAHVRRIERALPAAYRSAVRRGLQSAGAVDHATLVELCDLPDVIRGYEEVKLAGVERFHARAAELLEALDAPPAADPITVVRVPSRDR